MKNIKYILAACNNGQKKLGVERGPDILLSNMGKDSVYSTIYPKLFKKGVGYKKLYSNTKNILEMNNSAVILGGDHSISSSTVPAFFDVFNEKGIVLWFDAHPDINTPDTSTSGNLHGMPVASCLNLMDPVVKSTYLPSPQQIIYIGIRDIDPAEKEVIKDLNITYFTPENLIHDIYNVKQEIQEKTKNSVIHVSLDVDVMDPIFISATGTPVENGADFTQMQYLINSINLENVKSLDFVEFNPFIDNFRFQSNLDHCIKLLKMFH